MTTFRKVFLSLGLLAVAGVAQATTITLNGDHFAVTYDDTQVGLFGSGLMSGSMDTVYFQPTAFSALSGGSPASTLASLQLTFTINPGFAFTSLSFAERGDYFLLDGAGVDVAETSVQAVNVATSASTVLSLSPGSPLSQTGGSTAWGLTGNLLLSGLGSPQTMLVTLDNTLSANASAGSLGFIQETYAGFRITTAATPAAVPEPSSGALLAVGLMAALAGMRRRTTRV